MVNKKIKNATPLIYNGVVFRSKLEVTIYKTLIELKEKDINIKDIQYEPQKYVIWKGYKPTLPFYIKDKKTKLLKNDTTKIIDVTYTPDIVFYYGNNIVYVEVKPAMMNDVFPYKRKLFRKFLEDLYTNDNTQEFYPIYCQIGSKKEMIDFVNILNKEYLHND